MDDQRVDREGSIKDGITTKPRFSVKTMLLATTLIAVGLVMLYQVLNHDPRSSNWPVGLDYVLAYGGAAVIGAGALMPFRRPAIGAIAGMITQAVIIELT